MVDNLVTLLFVVTPPPHLAELNNELIFGGSNNVKDCAPTTGLIF